MSWEGKAKLIMTPRKTQQYADGFNNDTVLHRVAEWEKVAYHSIMKAWLRTGVDEGGRLNAERTWIENVLEPWAAKAQQQLEDYRKWKFTQASIGASAPLIANLDSIDDNVPEVYQKARYLLREANASGLWPSTTPKRQLVMVSTKADDEKQFLLRWPMSRPNSIRMNDRPPMFLKKAKAVPQDLSVLVHSLARCNQRVMKCSRVNEGCVRTRTCAFT
jgi:hypothetical protein